MMCLVFFICICVGLSVLRVVLLCCIFARFFPLTTLLCDYLNRAMYNELNSKEMEYCATLDVDKIPFANNTNNIYTMFRIRNFRIMQIQPWHEKLEVVLTHRLYSMVYRFTKRLEPWYR